ncbi:major facilitator superfamily transporter [Tritrichomonas foetus]|uniref:Major facilitator superfamily transporter n=1 Tax=Tritrichomonas foetus TaxID=1144522 RepID=A0A1J4JHP1_9EUKA|nr:major facilitator superfamily transporter [Tritrichomonas foetus]OHS98674.1 major facilitator superfamily transporter [Tritrichomonas foetus]|eukprot:OHS98673.1 major facilitator superfamily transporter [Tritrichomonas foetus]
MSDQESSSEITQSQSKNEKLLKKSNQKQDDVEMAKVADVKLSYWKIFMICAATFVNSFSGVINNSLITPLMNDVIHFEPYQSQIIWYFGPICGFVVQPLVGVISDHLHFKYGRRRIFILLGTVFLIISYAFIFALLFWNISQTAKKIIFVIAYFMQYASCNVMQGCARFIVGDLVPDSQQMIANTMIVFISAFCSIFGNLMSGFKVGTLIGEKYGNSMDDTKLMFIIGMIFMFLGCFITVCFVKEEQYTGNAPKENPFKKLWFALIHIKKPVLVINLVCAMSWMTFWPVCMNLSGFMTNDVFKAHNLGTYEDGLRWGMITWAVNAAVTVIFGFVLNPLIKKFGMKYTYAFSQALECVCLLPSNWITSNKWACMILMAILGVSTTCYSSIPYALIAQLLPPTQVGTYMGLLNMFLVVGQLISSIFICTLIGGKVFPGEYKQTFSIAAGVAVISCISCFFITEKDNGTIENEDEYSTESSYDRPDSL